MTLTGNEADWSNLPDIITSNTSAVQNNSATVPVISATGLSNGMRMLSNLPGIINVATTGNPPAATITNISSNDLTISPNQTLSFASGQLTNLLFSSQKGSSVYLPTNVVLKRYWNNRDCKGNIWCYRKIWRQRCYLYIRFSKLINYRIC